MQAAKTHKFVAFRSSSVKLALNGRKRKRKVVPKILLRELIRIVFGNKSDVFSSRKGEATEKILRVRTGRCLIIKTVLKKKSWSSLLQRTFTSIIINFPEVYQILGRWQDSFVKYSYYATLKRWKLKIYLFYLSALSLTINFRQ